MELDESYNLGGGLGLEFTVGQAYREGLKALRESEEPQEQLVILQGMSKSLGESHPGPDDTIGWVRDTIIMYRNLGKILGKIPGKFISPQEITSKYSDLFDDYREVNETDTKCIEKALEDLKDINKILKKHNINVGDTDELDVRLEEVGELEEKINSLANL